MTYAISVTNLFTTVISLIYYYNLNVENVVVINSLVEILAQPGPLAQPRPKLMSVTLAMCQLPEVNCFVSVTVIFLLKFSLSVLLQETTSMKFTQFYDQLSLSIEQM